MSVEGIGAEGTEAFNLDLTPVEEKSTEWNGRIVSVSSKSNFNIEKFLFLCEEKEQEENKTEKEIQFHGKVDDRGNKSLEGGFTIHSPDGNYSGGVSGRVNQDSDGKVSTEVEGTFSKKF